MRFRHAAGLALALGVFAPPTQAQTAKRSRVTDVEAEYNALMKGYNNATPKFYKLFVKLKTDKEVEDLIGDKTKNPAYMYLPRFQSLARRASHSKTSANSLLEIMRLLLSAKDAQAAASTSINSLVADYRDSPVIAEAAQQIGYMDWQLDTATPIHLLQKMMARCTGHTNKAAVMYGLACLYTDGNHGITTAQKAEANSLFAQLTAGYSDTPYAKRATEYVFQLQNLQVGMTAPDFEATDEAGRKFKLSDYRGKVVVVDFWGFW